MRNSGKLGRRMSSQVVWIPGVDGRDWTAWPRKIITRTPDKNIILPGVVYEQWVQRNVLDEVMAITANVFLQAGMLVGDRLLGNALSLMRNDPS